jgi:PAS domain S-box-containing protein
LSHSKQDDILIEEIMKKSEDKYRDVIDNLTEFVVRWKPGGTRTFVNKAYCDYYGITPEQAIGTSFMPLVAEEYRHAVEKRISRMTSENSVSTGEHLMVESDGTSGQTKLFLTIKTDWLNFCLWAETSPNVKKQKKKLESE